MQAELFPADEARRLAALPLAGREWTTAPVDRTGLAAFTIMIRAPGDPERRTREERHAALGRAESGAEWKSLAKVSVEAWAERFRSILAGGRAMTFNALCVEAADATADVAPDNAEAALWSMRDGGEVEHTVDAPVLWRMVVPR